MSHSAEKILIIGPSWVGDMVMAQSLFIDLKARYPDCQIDVLAPAWTAALIDRMPEVSDLIAVDFKHGKLSLAERWQIGKSLRNKGYTWAITLPNSLKSALVPWIAKIPRKTGFIGEQRWLMLNDIRRLDKQKLPMTVQRFIALGLDKQAEVRSIDTVPPPSLVAEQNAVSLLEKFQLNNQSPILVLCPGAEFGQSKKWPPESYADLANQYLLQGWQVWLMGSEKDKRDCQTISSLCQNKAQILAGKTSLPEAIDLMSLASLVVSNDSGLMHIAAALNRPLVAVYGSTDPGHTPPLSHNHRVAQLNLECSPCFKRECPLTHMNCMNQLSSQLVKKLAEDLQA